MPRLPTLLLLSSFLGGLVTATPQFNQEEELRNSKCDNGCFFGSFPGGSCTDDEACMCTQQTYREAYFCCMAEKCAADVLPESIIRQHSECRARNMDFTFDAEAVCGVALKYATTAVPGENLGTSTSTATATVSSGTNEPVKAAVSTVTMSTNSTATVTVTGSPTQSPPAEVTGNSASQVKGLSSGFAVLLLGAGMVMM